MRKGGSDSQSKTAREKRRKPPEGASRRERRIRSTGHSIRRRPTSAPSKRTDKQKSRRERKRRRRPQPRSHQNGKEQPTTSVPTEEKVSEGSDEGTKKYVKTSKLDKFDKRSSMIYKEFVDLAFNKGVTGIQQEFIPIRSYLPPGFTREAFDNNPSKSRYRDVLCVDATRVILEKESSDDGDYIHANFVRGPGRVRFICCQGPLDTTVIDFWRMIWQENCPFIVMLCGITENNKPKCGEYWPNTKGQTQQYGRFTIKNMQMTNVTLSGDQQEHITATKLMIQHSRTNEERQILHYQWSSWPDKGAPSSGNAALYLVHKFSDYKERTVVVHCSAGIGRTGTLVALHMCIERVKSHQTLDVSEVVKNLRDQRLHSVQTESQYVFIYKAMIDGWRDFVEGAMPTSELMFKFINEYRLYASGQGRPQH